MHRVYESSHACVDVSAKLYNDVKYYLPPAFMGLENLKGLDEPVGPFPKYNQPTFCNAHYPLVSFQLFPEQETRFLKIEMSLPFWGELSRNSCSISVNGSQQSSLTMSQKGKLYSTTIPIYPSNDSVKIQIDFDNWDTNTASQVAASVTSIQLMTSPR
jgi:hypothetical protein